MSDHESRTPPKGKGWFQQRNRWRLTASYSAEIAHRIGEEAEALGVSPSTLITMIVGRHYADKER